MAKGLICCDKCGSVFNPKTAYGIFGSVNNIQLANKDTYDNSPNRSITTTAASITVGCEQKPFDLCPECMGKLLDFLKPNDNLK